MVREITLRKEVSESEIPINLFENLSSENFVSNVGETGFLDTLAEQM